MKTFMFSIQLIAIQCLSGERKSIIFSCELPNERNSYLMNGSLCSVLPRLQVQVCKIKTKIYMGVDSMIFITDFAILLGKVCTISFERPEASP